MTEQHAGAAKPSWRAAAVFVLVLLLMVGGWYRRRRQPSPEPAPPPREIMQVGIMGTYAKVTMYGGQAASEQAAEKVFAVFTGVDQQFSTYKPDSELSRLNASADQAPFDCSERMWELLGHARRAYQLSGGGFDISAGPLMKLWGFYRKRDAVPSADEIKAVLTRVGLDKVVFDEQAKTVRFSVAGMSLDLGGIAKGYAVDLAADALAAMKIGRGIIDLGGNIYCLPEPPPGRQEYRIGVRHPRHPRDASQLISTVPLLGQAIATSGDYERFVVLDGRRYSHIMDPRTGYPVGDMASVTVVAPRALTTDILSTAIFVDRAEGLEGMIGGDPQVHALVIRAKAEGKLEPEPHGQVWEAIQGL